jgi:hypothetical protein
MVEIRLRLVVKPENFLDEVEGTAGSCSAREEKVKSKGGEGERVRLQGIVEAEQ